MKSSIPVGLALICLVLVAAITVIKHLDDVRHDADISSIVDFSNRLDSAQSQITIREGTLVILSNRLDEMTSATGVFSNQLEEARSQMVRSVIQIANFNRQITDLESKNQTLQRTSNQSVAELTNEVAELTERCRVAGTNLERANAEYALLDNRLRRDVAERLVLERKFNDPTELKQHIQYLKFYPAQIVTANSIYAGLDVEVISNRVHVIIPN
jgi:chromosome segregation ATPase